MSRRRGRIHTQRARRPKCIQLGESALQRSAMPRARDDGLDVTQREELPERDFREPAAELGQTLTRDH